MSGEQTTHAFHAWLLQQTDRRDAVGDLAFDVRQDPTFPKRARRLATVAGYLRAQGACPLVLRAAEQAWREWAGAHSAEGVG